MKTFAILCLCLSVITAGIVACLCALGPDVVKPVSAALPVTNNKPYRYCVKTAQSAKPICCKGRTDYSESHNSLSDCDQGVKNIYDVQNVLDMGE